MIQTDPDGRAFIGTTRIYVWTLSALWALGATDAYLLHEYPSLTPEDLEDARAWLETHSLHPDDLKDMDHAS